MKNKFIFTLLLFSIVSATISPACAFISGKGTTWIEICSGLQNKLIPTGNQSTPPDMTEKQCPFCIQHFTFHGITVTPTVITAGHIGFYRGFSTESALSQFLKSTGNRDPPFYS